MLFKKKSLAKIQIDVFSEWQSRSGKTFDCRYLRELIALFKIHDIMDITDDLISDYLKHVADSYGTQYAVSQAKSAINSITRFYMARSKNAKLPVGRPPLIEKIERVKKYRKLGLSYPEINKITGDDISLLYRWVQYPTEKLALYRDIPGKTA